MDFENYVANIITPFETTSMKFLDIIHIAKSICVFAEITDLVLAENA